MSKIVVKPYYRCGSELPADLRGNGRLLFEVAFAGKVGRSSSFQSTEEYAKVERSNLEEAGVSVTLYKHAVNGKRIYRTTQIFGG